LRCLTQDVDTTTASGRLVFTISAIAEFERVIIQERTRAGLDAARARGRPGGRPPGLQPRDLKEVHVLLRDPEITVEEVAARLKVSPSTLYRHLPSGRGAVVDTTAEPA
jgi:DNA invertase Pin-like site-specific DNA recombinase